jgi:hypothetical protein
LLGVFVEKLQGFDDMPGNRLDARMHDVFLCLGQLPFVKTRSHNFLALAFL